MPHTRSLRRFNKTSQSPRRPWEKERLISELQTIGEYGLKNKREVWRVRLALAKIRKTARTLLTMHVNEPKRIFEGAALLRRLHRYGILDESKDKLDYVLGLKMNDFLERRLQTQIFKLSMADTIHEARVTVRQRHVRVRNQLVDVPSYMVRVDSQKHLDFAQNSPYGGGRPGRYKRKKDRLKREAANQPVVVEDPDDLQLFFVVFIDMESLMNPRINSIMFWV